MDKMLIVYYSWSNGNTEKIAKQLQAVTGAELVQIDTVQPYEGSYDAVVDQGQKEVNQGYMPPIQPIAVNVNAYDVVAVGTPTWWYTMAPAMKTFLAQENWNGKTVIPFATNGGWPGHVIKDIKDACKGAVFADAMEVQFDSTGGDQMKTSQTEIDNWLKKFAQK